MLIGSALFALGVFSDDEPTTTRVATPITSPVPEGSSEPAGEPVGCESTHSGHNVMRWNATMADEMVAAGCEWPYDPFLVPLEGGEEDPALDAPFEARLYSEIWDMIGQVDVGVCAVSALPEEPGAGGFVFGFDYGIASQDALPTPPRTSWSRSTAPEPNETLPPTHRTSLRPTSWGDGSSPCSARKRP